MNLRKKIHVLEKPVKTTSIIKYLIESGYEEAFYVCDIGSIIRKHRLWNEALPTVQPHYAMKCNDKMEVLETLAALGVGFDCASKNEISKILSMGVDPDKIIYANPVKSIPHLRYARQMGVTKMTFDNETELHKIKRVFPEAELIIRIKCDSPTAIFRLGDKFGCDHVLEAPQLLKTAKKLGLQVTGVSFHIGSCVRDFSAFGEAIAFARRVFDVSRTLGFRFTLLDIGGGFPGRDDDTIHDIGTIINATLREYFADPLVRVVAEPGRYYVQQAYTLVCRVNSVKRVAEDVQGNGDVVRHNKYYIDDGIYGSFNCVLFGEPVYPTALKETSSKELISSSMWGPSCDAFDLVVKDIMFEDLEMGDWIVFANMGSYSLAVATTFNGFSCPDSFVVTEKSMWNIIKDSLPKNSSAKKHNTFRNKIFMDFKEYCSQI